MFCGHDLGRHKAWYNNTKQWKFIERIMFDGTNIFENLFNKIIFQYF